MSMMSRVGGAVACAAAAGAALGQTSPRVDYRVLAEFGSAPSGDWPFVAGSINSPGGIIQLHDGSVMWYDSVIRWINDSGVSTILEPGTRIAGLPDEDLTFLLRYQAGSYPRALRQSDGRTAFPVQLRRTDGSILGYATLLGPPGAPEIGDTRSILRVADDGRVAALESGAFGPVIGPLGGVLEPLFAQDMPVGGAAPAGSRLLSVDALTLMFGPADSHAVTGTLLPTGRSFIGVMQGGNLRALLYDTDSIPGVSVPASARLTSVRAVTPEGDILMTSTLPVTAAWLVHPDGTGRDIVTPSTRFPGYPADYRATAGVQVSMTADGRLYVFVRSFIDGASQQYTSPGLFEFMDGQMRLIVASGDPRLHSPGGRSSLVFERTQGNTSWIGSGGKIAWVPSQSNGGTKAVVFADAAGAVVSTMWKGEPAPGPLAGFGEVHSLGCTDVLGADTGPTGTDLPSDTTRLATDGSLAFWVTTQDRSSGRVRMFLMSARLDVCPPDINEDGFIDFFDYDAFVGCFESGEGCGRFDVGDFNQDGFTDFFDYMEFVEAFEAGC